MSQTGLSAVSPAKSTPGKDSADGKGEAAKDLILIRKERIVFFLARLRMDDTTRTDCEVN